MIYVLIGVAALFAVSTIIFMYEAKNAPVIDSKEPFLHDDYYPKKTKQ